MKKNLLLLVCLLLLNSISKAQISGSALLCPGFVYTYTANIVGASTYTWTTPVGWQIVSGQGTSQVEVMCNQNEGDICADGYDGGGVFIAQNCFTALWGGDGTGWDAIKNTIGFCICSPYTITVQSNGGSSPCGGCGSGTLSANAVYAVYNDSLPSGVLIGLADGITPYFPDTTAIITLYVYLVDTSAGLANAVPLTGSTCLTTINNAVQLFPCYPPTIIAQVLPSPVCVGDTFTIKENSGLGTFPIYQWSCPDVNLNFLSPNGVDSILGTYTGIPGGNPTVYFTATDMFNCPYVGQVAIDVVNCIVPPVALFTISDDTICLNTCANFTNLSTNGTSFQWTFYGASADTSSLEIPPAICYINPGSFDVKLVVTNGGGVDSVTLTNVIYVFSIPPPQNIVLINDTLFANQGFFDYQWYYNSVIIPGANDNFYLPTANGSYTINSTDSNGCESSFVIQNILLSNSYLEQVSISVYPNPTSNNFIINLGNKNSAKLEVMNNLGEIIYNQNLTQEENHISPGILPAGVYYLRVSSKDSIQIQKIFIIQK